MIRITASRLLAVASTSLLTVPAVLNAQADDSARSGTLDRISVYGPSLEGNLEGDDPSRDVFVYLPPSYTDASSKRYPVVYFLHGYGLTAKRFVDFVGLPDAADSAIASGVDEMIIVLPDAYTLYSGSMYSNSPTTGDWEGYISNDLVAHIDRHYRTIPNRQSRGLAGHSMGGYGTLRIGMKHPEAFGAFYAMSSCCLMNQAPSREQVEAQIAERGDAPAPQGGFANVQSALAAAWAPNPERAPRYFDWPYENGEALPLVQAKWIANSPLVFVDQYVSSLKRYNGIFLDVGDADGLRADNERLDMALERLGVEHTFELYEGDHVNRVAARFTNKLLPFFSQALE
jgi:S-formylglutathione hydrolase FrmB